MKNALWRRTNKNCDTARKEYFFALAEIFLGNEFQEISNRGWKIMQHWRSSSHSTRCFLPTVSSLLDSHSSFLFLLSRRRRRCCVSLKRWYFCVILFSKSFPFSPKYFMFNVFFCTLFAFCLSLFCVSSFSSSFPMRKSESRGRMEVAFCLLKFFYFHFYFFILQQRVRV